MSGQGAIHLALQFGRMRHFREGLAEFSRRLGAELGRRAALLRAERNWQFHFILERRWHGLFGEAVSYRPITDRLRWPHRSDPAFAVWHGLHQHMRYRPPSNARARLITVHDFNYLTEKRGFSRIWYGQRVRRTLGRATALVAISSAVADDARTVLGAASDVRIIHNGVADLSTAPRAEVPEVGEAPFLLHLSRMSPSKNVDAIVALATAWPEQRFVLAGPDGGPVRQYRESVGRRGLRNVTVLADVSDEQKAWLYARSAGFVFPSLVEGFGMPPIEAMYFGKPVFVTRLSCLPEVCGDAAYYFDSFEPARMREVIESGLARAETRAGAVRAWAGHYSWQRAANQYLALYERLLAPRRR
ncbi:MAG TPA: glycosyltransferase family 1 protein [Steroidobacteraceae bacterium]|nr:glycosyltransferase family 1 protein [Steroidobacteraceae bacterium]